MTDRSTNRQYAPWPVELEVLVAEVRYRDGWRFDLSDQERDPAESHGQPAGGLTLTITTLTVNSYEHDKRCQYCGQEIARYRVRHIFPVPPATFDRQAWLGWLMDRIEDVEAHEAREFFRLVHTKIVDDGQEIERVEERPFAPNHGPGRDPYRRYSYASDQDRRTRFTGVVNES